MMKFINRNSGAAGNAGTVIDVVAKQAGQPEAPPPLEVRRPSPQVAEVWLNRPDVRNAFNDEVVVALKKTFVEFAEDETLRVVVLGAHGKAFCAGADLNWMRAMADFNWDQNRADAGKLADMLWALWRCPVPVVGRVQGDCYAGGMGLAAICDVLVAAEDVTFCLSETRLGLLPATISPYVVRAMGEQAARRYMITAERFSATQAHAIGFVHELVAPESLDAKVAEIVQALCANGPAAVRASKKLVRDVASEPLTAELRADTAKRIADIRASDEGKEGVQSFLNKRRPIWQA